MARPPRNLQGVCALARNEEGATAIEFALILPLLCFTLMSIIEIGVMGMMSTALDHAVLDASRRIRTGRTDGPTSASTFEDQICATMGGSSSDCHSRLVTSVQKFSKFTGSAAAAVTATPANQFDKGGPGDIVVVRADYNWPLMSPFLATAFHSSGPMSVTIASRLAFKNEPYK